MKRHFPRILIGGFRGGTGKTLVSMGMLAAWRQQGKSLAVFKKGPDYIDAAWLARASGRLCYNLDTYLMGEEVVRKSFRDRSQGAEIAFVEGNRGFFDGMDEEGRHSSAVLAALLRLSVFLVIDCTKSTRTVAALLKGCQVLDSETTIRGVILNQVSTPRHETVVRRSIESLCGIPVFGAIPRIRRLNLLERHLGLFPPQEHGTVEGTLHEVQDLVERHVDLESLLAAARSECEERSVSHQEKGRSEEKRAPRFSGIRVGVVKDSAFHFYYPENIEALSERGAEIVEVDASREPSLPGLDALYIGGGFPETQARDLAENQSFKESLRRAVEGGLPVYAECGGAIYLGKGIEVADQFYPLVGIFPLVYRFHASPQGHGYTLLRVEEDNPLFPRGIRIKGHEFHYVGVSRWEAGMRRFACRVERGYGFDGCHEGLWHGNAYATFSHLHALGESHWADRFLKQAAAQATA